jgi:hypothetical protein
MSDKEFETKLRISNENFNALCAKLKEYTTLDGDGVTDAGTPNWVYYLPGYQKPWMERMIKNVTNDISAGILKIGSPGDSR